MSETTDPGPITAEIYSLPKEMTGSILTIQPGDKVVVRVFGNPEMSEVKRVQAIFERYLGREVLVVNGEGIDILAIRHEPERDFDHA